MSDEITTPKTFTAEEVEQMLAQQRVQERTISALLTAIQRSVASGDEPAYTECLRLLMRQIAGIPVEQPKPEESNKDES